MSQPLQFLLLEDSALDAEFLLDQLQEGGLEAKLVRVETRDAFAAALSTQRFDVILADYSLPAFNGMEALDIAQSLRPEVPFIFVSGRLGEELAIESLQRGATDYVVKQRLERLVPAVKRALTEARERAERRRAESALAVLADAGIALSSTLDYEETMASIAKLAVPHFADCCTVDIVTEGGMVRRLAVVHIDGSMADWCERMKAFPPALSSTRHPLPRVLRDGKAKLFREMPDNWAERLIDDPEHREVLKEIPIYSVMVVPLEARGRMLGALSFLSSTPDRLFDEVDLGLATDLARRAALAVDNAQLHQRTLQAVRVRDEFLATVSHELRTPLNAVLGWVGLLRSGALEVEETDRALETIERNARAQAKLIEDLLDVSRIISGKLKLSTQPVDLLEVAAIVIDGSRPGALAKEIQLGLAPCSLDPEERTVTGDVQRMQQIVWNLVSNGIKFTPKGGRIEIEVAREGEQLCFRVHDSGPGIAADFLPFVFERFRQADGSTSRHYGGLGLGLAIVRHLAELHGGTVEVASPGKLGGASFTVNLPGSRAIVLGEPEKVVEKYGRGGGRKHGKLEGIRIVLVDDDEDGRQAVAAVLRHMGAQVREADSAAAAIVAVESGPADVLLSDIGMPGEDGYSLMSRLREWEVREGRELPAAALTAYSRESDRRLTQEAGFKGHLAKPVDPGTLAALVLELAGR